MCSQTGDVKEFLRGFVAAIAIEPNAAHGTITYYQLPLGSLMGVPGAGVEPAGAEGPRDFKFYDSGN
jgi:hypothetical protein